MVHDAQITAEAEIRRLADRYRIHLDVDTSAGTFGARQGRETGASVEIQDFRDYTPGDDPRRIDWFSFARTGRLIVRLYREEVSPYFDVIVDVSASMAIRDGRKGPLVLDLCRWLFRSAQVSGVALRLFAAGESLSRVEAPEELNFSACDSVLFSAPYKAVGGLRRSSVRLVLSDFMSPAGAAQTLRALAAGCTRLIVVHLLGPWEAAPKPSGPCVLKAVETGRRGDILLDRRTVEEYCKRLQALKEEIRKQTFQCGGILVEVTADQDLESVLRTQFLPVSLVKVL